MPPHRNHIQRPGTPVVVTPEELQQHADSVRALARRLLCDEHAAEDVVQDTWVLALERPPRELESSESLGSWLRSVARNLVRRQVRGRERREQRERERSRPEASGSGEDQSAEERAATLRSLTEAVLSLSEPYRGTLLQRYFENLPPREIAKREGVSVATVKSRLQRGLERLRSGLDGDQGPGWRRELAAFVGQPLFPPGGGPPEGSTPELVESAQAASTPGVFPMAGTNLIAGALVVAVATTAAWQLAAPETAERTERSSLGGLGLREGPPPIALDQDSTDDDSARVAVGEWSSGSAASELPQGSENDTTLEVAVVDRNGLPVPGADIFAAPFGHAINRIGTTGSRGKLSFTWQETGPVTELALSVGLPGGGSLPLQSLRLGRGTQSTLEIVGGDLWGFPTEGRSVFEERLPTQAPPMVAISSSTWSVAEGLPGPDPRPGSGHPLYDPPTALLDDAGRTTFLELHLPEEGLQSESPSSEFVVVSGHEVLVEGLAVDLMPVQTVSLLELESPPPASITGWVRDEDGVARAGIPVAVLGLDGALLRYRTTDEEGAFRIQSLPDGDYVLHAGGGLLGLARANVTTRAGEPCTWSAQLEPQARIEGRVSSAQAGAEEGSDPDWKDYAVIATADGPGVTRSCWSLLDEDGRFSLPALGSRMRIEVTTARHRVPGLTVTSAAKHFANFDNLPIPMSAEERELCELRLSVRSSSDRPLVSPWIRLWQEGHGRGVWMHPAAGGSSDLHEQDGVFAFQREHLPPGSYTLEIGAAGHDTRTLENRWISPGETVDLGTLVLSSE